MAEREIEVCARCGHQSGGCPRCGVNHPFLGASINKLKYCHTFVDEPGPTCYMLASWGTTDKTTDETILRRLLSDDS